jgi:hypothetical protein
MCLIGGIIFSSGMRQLGEEREGRTWNAVRDEFVRESEEFLEEYSNLDGGLWNQRFWEQRNPTPAWVLKHNTEHYREHLDRIRKKWGSGKHNECVG